MTDRRRRQLLQSALAVSASAALLGTVQPSTAHAASLEVSVSPIKQNYPNACARTCAVMVLNYFGFEVGLNERRVINSLPDNAHISKQVRPALGELTSEEMRAEWFVTNRSDYVRQIYAEISSDYPIIALIPDAKGIGWSFRGHYVVITGMTWRSGRDQDEIQTVIFCDPWDGNRRELPASQFASAWGTGSDDANGWQGLTFWPN